MGDDVMDSIRRGQAALDASIDRRAEAQRQSTVTDDRERWPEPLDSAAYHGLAGEIVRAVEPQTEADNAALLLQLLVGFGIHVGRGPHVRVEADQHHTNLNVLLVGETSKGRKGTAYGRVRQLFADIDDRPKEVHGLSTGEGLKFAVRDPIERLNHDKKTRQAVWTVVDPGVEDKRLLVVETEFSQALRAAARPGNTLSAAVRCAWDTGNLATVTKTDPVTATRAHIGIIGHITVDELRAELTATDTANGFANRYLFVGVRRSKTLPFGGASLSDEAAGFAARIKRAAVHARGVAELSMTAAARELRSPRSSDAI